MQQVLLPTRRQLIEEITHLESQTQKTDINSKERERGGKRQFLWPQIRLTGSMIPNEKQKQHKKNEKRTQWQATSFAY